jgi:integrase
LSKRIYGEGSIYWNNDRNRWVAQILLPNSKRRSKSFTDKKQALNWLASERTKINQGLFVADESIKLGDFLNSYMAEVAIHNLRPTTYQTNYSLIKNHIIPGLGNIKLSKLQPSQVQAFYSQKLSEGLARRTVAYLHAILHKCLDQALRWGLVNRNITDLVDVPSPQRRSPTVWSLEEAKTFLKAVEHHRWYPIYVLAIFTGMRKGEILGLHRNDINVKSGVVNVRHQITQVKGEGSVVSEPKTQKSRRQITLSPFACVVMEDHLLSLDKNQLLIFTTSTGKPISSRNVVRHFKSVIEKEGLPDIRFHDLRHTHATMLLSAGTHPKVVQERLGHSQISLTLDTYSHVIPTMQREASDQFEAMFNP